ncbi:MAG: RNA methyltransferase [Mycoplasmataceae bacterium RC_NB112A]|nr:MAG: RNA methyltransferase [Mycoplasmataceae bacterium RC_NB112A]
MASICEPYAKEYNKFNFDFLICLIFGNEHQGIRKNLVKKSDYSLYIPMNNNISSLNVSVRLGIILAQVVFGQQKEIE